MTDVVSIDPRTGTAVEVVAAETTTAQVDDICRAALAAASDLDALGRDGRAGLLNALADALEAHLPGRLTARLLPRAGRIVFDGYPTGVAVAWAQHHGGPWPATNSQHTSVGTSAIRRFLRPVAWQNTPADLLPAELRDGYQGIPRRVDGVLHPASSAA